MVKCDELTGTHGWERGVNHGDTREKCDLVQSVKFDGQLIDTTALRF